VTFVVEAYFGAKKINFFVLLLTAASGASSMAVDVEVHHAGRHLPQPGLV